MKTLKSLIAFSSLGLLSLAGCGGISDAGMEDTVGTVEQAECATPEPFANCTELTGPFDCNAGGNHYTYLCQMQPYGCKLFRDSDCTWSGYTDTNCAGFKLARCL
jgi:hypothetical protein